ncbi:FAD-dependent thymidylate synthase [Patescibacteria group bacterium]|nr:FAD-dependent thymidylate synthase [Patescibacteria group bacterium]
MQNKDIKNLKHSQAQIKGGGKVIILNAGSVIGPEAEAMLQALHSRSTGGLESHLEILADKGPDNFMKNFYVGYGHKSIGDCGSTSIFIEGISMLAAKAIQDWPLYSGQESSTRYVDFKTQPFKNPIGTKEGKEILESYRKFYTEALEQTKEYLKIQFPLGSGEKESIYNKAIDARAFDILRGFLPAGSTTNIAWHTNLRQAADKIILLRHHPLMEVRNLAEAIEQALRLAFPNSFGHKHHKNTENYNKKWMEKDYYYHDKNCPNFKMVNNSINKNLLSRKILEERSIKTELPKHLAEAGTLQFKFLLDFGSFRDIQRHRAVIQRMPLLTTEISFGKWYLEELPKKLKVKAKEFIKKQEGKIKKLKISKEEKQYYIAMGYNTSNRLTGNLPALIYLAELRSTRFVHPTLRNKAKMIANTLLKLFKKSGLVIHLDKEMDRFDIKRGEHDIVLR